MWWGFIENSVVIFFTLLLFAACKPTAHHATKIYLASSLIPLGDAIKEHMHEPVDLVFLSSSAIAKQIEQGAPCEMAILADEAWRDYLLQKNLIIAKTESLLSNSLVLASVEAHDLQAAAIFFAKLPAHERIIIADPDYVPLGTYTREALQSLGFYQKFELHFLRASSARQATIMLSQRAARFGVLYRSDALHAKLNIVFSFDAKSHRPIRYPLVQCKTAREKMLPDLVHTFLSKQFKDRFTSLGFY